MHRDILPHVIFSPGFLALQLADGLQHLGATVTLFTPGPVDTSVANSIADLSLFEAELARRGDNPIDLLKKHPFTFITLARQLQNELIADVYARANNDEFDIVHIYTNEEESALAFAGLCQKPVLFTHHDPFNFMVKYKSNLPKYADRNWLSLSYAQRAGMPNATHWVGNIYHGLNEPELHPVVHPSGGYVAYLGRIIKPKGVHLAIAAVKKYNETAAAPLTLKIAGKHYADGTKDTYWHDKIAPVLGSHVEFVGFIDNAADKREFLANANALIVPSLFDEPFGMVSIESFACGAPVVALDSGALPEVIEHGKTGIVVPKIYLEASTEIDERATTDGLVRALRDVASINRADCRHAYEERFTLTRMCEEHLRVYQQLDDNQVGLDVRM